MNRRQFLTGASAAAVSSALPMASVSSIAGAYEVARMGGANEPFILQRLYFASRIWAITGTDNVIHFSEPCDPDFFVPKIA